MSDIKFSNCPFTAKHCEWCGELYCSDREYETPTVTVRTYNTINMEQKELTAQEIVERLIDEQKISGKEAAILLNTINKPAEIRIEKEYTPWYQLDTGEPIDCINCTEDCMNCPGPYNNCSKTYTATKEVPDFTELTMKEKDMEEMERKEQKPQNTKSEINFADNYSKMIWEKLMSEFKAIEGYQIGANEVSDIVLNAILNAFMWQKEQKPSEWSEEDEKVFADIISDIEYYRDLEDVQFHDSYNKKIRLLKSLYRSNFQSNREWNEEDEKMLKWVEDILLIANGDLNNKLNGKASPITDSAYSSIKRCIVKSRSWLESLPERFNLEPKDQKPLEYLPKEKVYHIMHELSKLSLSDIIPIESEEYEKIDEITSNVRDLLDYPIEPKAEWSEEDKHRCKDAIYFLETAKKHYADTSEIELTIEWLKSLQPQAKQYKQCIYGDTPSVERCAVCSAWCDRRVREEDK